MSERKPHEYNTCNCPGCRAIRVDIKYHGRTSRAVPTGPWPPREPKAEEPTPPTTTESNSTPTPPAPKAPANKKK